MVGEVRIAALGAWRTGRMHDIVATIQAEQDSAPLPGASWSPVVRARARPPSPCTAAYLLYTHRKPGVTGRAARRPSPIFLRYIDEVLPSLGEDEVMLAVPSSLKPRLVVRAVDPPDVAALKGNRRMAGVIANDP